MLTSNTMPLGRGEAFVPLFLCFRITRSSNESTIILNDKTVLSSIDCSEGLTIDPISQLIMIYLSSDRFRSFVHPCGILSQNLLSTFGGFPLED